MSTQLAATDFQHFDLVAGLERCCGDTEFLGDMIDLLAQSLPEQWSALEQAIATENAGELDESAHALKGVLSTLTNGAPYQLARELEDLGKSGSTTGAASLATALQAVIQELTTEVQGWRTIASRTVNSSSEGQPGHA